jgi:hypothetical protein
MVSLAQRVCVTVLAEVACPAVFDDNFQWAGPPVGRGAKLYVFSDTAFSFRIFDRVADSVLVGMFRHGAQRKCGNPQ